MPPTEDREFPPCPETHHLSAYVQRELLPSKAEHLRAHLKQCATCSHEHASLQVLLTDIGSLSEPDEAPSLADRVRSNLRGLFVFPFAHWGRSGWRLLGVATSVIAITTLATKAVHSVRPDPSLDPARHRQIMRERCVMRLKRTQGAGGSWDAGAYSIALTGLNTALLARAQIGDSVELDQVLKKSAHWLMRQQRPSGEFRSDGPPSILQHVLATWGLMEVYSRRGDEDVKGVVQAALRPLRESLVSGNPRALWHLSAAQARQLLIATLMRAEECGLITVDDSIRRVLRGDGSISGANAVPTLVLELCTNGDSLVGAGIIGRGSLFLLANQASLGQ